MSSKLLFPTAFILAALLGASPAAAKVMKSDVAFNTGIGKPTGDQPPGGMTVAYPIELAGDLAGCTANILESLHGREEGAWGIFDIAADVTCADGGFSYVSSGAWDGNGFHAAGMIVEGSGTGAYEGVSGRIAQLGGSGSDAGDGTFDIAYELVVETSET